MGAWCDSECIESSGVLVRDTVGMDVRFISLDSSFETENVSLRSSDRSSACSEQHEQMASLKANCIRLFLEVQMVAKRRALELDSSSGCRRTWAECRSTAGRWPGAGGLEMPGK